MLHRRGLSASSNSRAASNRASGVMVAQWNLSCTLGLRLCLREAFAVAHQVLAGWLRDLKVITAAMGAIMVVILPKRSLSHRPRQKVAEICGIN